MKQVFIGIFAHPDDESFGPSGTLALKIAQGADVHLICATGGESGMNPDNHYDLGKVRIQEWQAAGSLLGAKSQHHLEYLDGSLCNNIFRELSDKTENIITDILATYPRDIEVTLVTMDQNGISGHIDHITMSYVACFVFAKMRTTIPQLKSLWFFCVSEKLLPNANTSFVYMSKGRTDNEIEIRINISTIFEQKKQIMRAHASQRKDAEMLIARAEQSNIFEECFYTYKD